MRRNGRAQRRAPPDHYSCSEGQVTMQGDRLLVDYPLDPSLLRTPP
jgi:hypothetical protein